MSDLLYNQHTLFLRNGEATAVQIKQAFEAGIKAANLAHPELRLKPLVYVNVALNAKLEPLGRTFVYVPDARAFNCILGLNPDGSPREEIVQTISDLEIPVSKSSSWGDMMDEIEEVQKKHSIVRTLPPLVTLPAVILNDSPDLQSSQQMMTLSPARTYVDPTDYFSYYIKSQGVPRSITADDIRREIAYLSTSSDKRYPLVTITEGTAVVEFDKNTDDARFALYMIMKVTISKRGKDHTLLFSYLNARHSPVPLTKKSPKQRNSPPPVKPAKKEPKTPEKTSRVVRPTVSKVTTVNVTNFYEALCE